MDLSDVVGLLGDRDARPRLLVCASTLPLADEPGATPALHALTRALARHAYVTILVPGTGGERPAERLGAVEVERFDVGPSQWGRRREPSPDSRDDLGLFGLSSRQALAFVHAQARAVRRVVGDHRIEVVHSHGMLLQGLAVALARGRRPRFRHVMTLHGGESWGRVPARRAVARFVCARADRLLAVSSSACAELDAVLQTSCGAHLQPMGIDVARQRAGAIAESPFPNGFLLAVSGLGPRDADEELLRALVRVRMQVPDVGLILVGDGPEATRLVGLVHELGLGDAVQFVGERSPDAVAALLRGSRALVLPTAHRDGTTGLALRALAAGSRVVALRDADAADVIQHRHNGWLAESSAPDALAGPLIDALRTPRGHAIDDRGRATAEAHDWPRVARAYLGEPSRTSG